MKRGKEDDKMMGPMFPRLHVNDAGKGGPRAPPRNKMALYEQLTIPSQRHNSVAHPNANTINTPPTSTMQMQGTGHERNMYFPLYRPPSTLSYDEAQVSRPEAGVLNNVNNQMLQGENRKQPLEDDDFMVPIFSQPGTMLCNGRNQSHMHEDRRNLIRSGHLTALPCMGEKETGQSNNEDFPKQHLKNQDRRSSRVFEAPTRYSSDILMREKDDWRKDAYAQNGHQDKCRMRSLEKTGACLRQDHDGELSSIDATNGAGVSDQPSENLHGKKTSGMTHNPRVECHYKGDNEVGRGMQRVEEYQSLEKESPDKGDDISETSMEDNVSGLDLGPDDVVRVIGRKHFWKARTAIANQQRVFAVQIFELHRLLKVQKLIAESPDMLIEGSAFVGKTSLKGSAVKKFSSEYAVDALVRKNAQKDDSHKATDKMEGTAENAVTKSPPIPPQNAIQPTAYQPSSVNTVSSFPPGNMDPKMNPWNFHQPAPHQWLVPVMSPSEGLVYKPYPAPGCMGPVCAGLPPVMNPAYGMPTPQYQQGMGMPPGMHFGGQGYFPPYGMPMPIMSPSVSGSTVEQFNQFSGPNPYGQTGQPVGTSVNYGSMQQQSSLNIPHQRNGPITPVARSLPSKDRELQGSTASSPGQRTQETGTVPLMEGRDALPLFPAAPTTKISEGSPTEKPTRVIRVVPQKSTRESAARIFQSIQEERRQY